MLHIAVSGNIGSGKTTLTELLAKQLNLNAIYENIDNNPYIISFYNDMKRWSFNLQIYFLCSRFKQTMEIQKPITSGPRSYNLRRCSYFCFKFI